MKRLIATIMSCGYLFFTTAYAEGGFGKEPEIDFYAVRSDFENKKEGPGDASGLYCYSRGNVRGKKRDVYVLSLPKGKATHVADYVRNICWNHLESNDKIAMNKDTAIWVAWRAAIASMVGTTGTVAMSLGVVACPLPVIIGTGICTCCCGGLGCCTSCISCGITAKSKDIVELCNKLNELVRSQKFLNSNALIIAFDKRESNCCRKSVYVGFKHIPGLDESLVHTVVEEDYFNGVQFVTDRLVTDDPDSAGAKI